MKIYEIEKRIFDEHGNIHHIGRWLKSTKEKSDRLIDSEVEKEKAYASRIKDTPNLGHFNYGRVVDVYIGNEGYRIQFTESIWNVD